MIDCPFRSVLCTLLLFPRVFIPLRLARFELLIMNETCAFLLPFYLLVFHFSFLLLVSMPIKLSYACFHVFRVFLLLLLFDCYHSLPWFVCVVSQGWFLGAVSIVASRPSLFRRLFLLELLGLGRLGIYAFRFFKNGHWMTVIIDDLIPCRKEQREQASGANPQRDQCEEQRERKR